MDCKRYKLTVEPPKEFLIEVYDYCKEHHPGKCYGMWRWVMGSFLVKCQGCGYELSE